MRHVNIELRAASPGLRHELTVFEFGQRGASPKVYVQAGLHADESPGHVTAHALRLRLEQIEADGHLKGCVTLVPLANPIGLAQQVLGTLHGRFDLSDGVNFNREYPDLAALVQGRISGQLCADEAENTALIRSALRDELVAMPALTATDDMKHHLLRLAVDADIVLDLHCDSEATMHLYTLTTQASFFVPLGAHLQAKAHLTAMESGGNPFDEALSRLPSSLRKLNPGFPVAEFCHATTVELRGEADVSHTLAANDAEAILAFLADKGVVDMQAIAPEQCMTPLPACSPTPLEGMEPLVAPAGGVIVFHSSVGDHIQAGETVADIVDPASGAVFPVRARTSGILFARTSSRFARSGKRLGKIAGTNAFRSGTLLGP
jgi:uncharacterized protein